MAYKLRGLPKREEEAEQDVIIGGLLGAHSILLCAEGAGSEGYVFGGSAMVLVRAPRAPRDLIESGLELKCLISTEKPFLSFLSILNSSARITPCEKSRMKDTEGDAQEDDWADQTMHWTRGDVPGEDISEQSLNEEACVETSERDYSGGTNERVPEATRRGQKKWPEKRSRERGHRGQEKRSKKRYRQMMADGKNPEHARDLYGWRTTRRRVVDKGTVRFRMADGRSMKVTEVRHVSLRCKIRSDEALKLVEEHSEFPRETGNAAREGRLKGYTDWRGVSRQEELLSDIGPMSGTGAQGDALGYVQKSGQTREGATSAGCPWRSSEERDKVDEGEMESRRLAKRCTLQRTPMGGAGHLSEKVQALRFKSAITSMEVKLPVDEGNASRILSCRYYRGAGPEVVEMDNLKNLEYPPMAGGEIVGSRPLKPIGRKPKPNKNKAQVKSRKKPNGAQASQMNSDINCNSYWAETEEKRREEKRRRKALTVSVKEGCEEFRRGHLSSPEVSNGGHV
ncbi:hypothetical protein Acr_05g0000880 [Actinidia rufa]|uniref:Uncharacterized protein n=1 Tax=Actinidia rufa TaxID=165716 RepID=A0A7J0EKK4_9ERIC|nr:hypothetical protein Acr_05g0000880 [Actinidia rufa]